ncbi:MAG: hypothetical protein ACKVZ0_07020 [Gemmatimonadales bacterium]
MRRSSIVVFAGVLLLVPAALPAQHGTPGGGGRVLAPAAEASQFDFLIGQWEITVQPRATSLAARIHGAPKLGGTWKAWRAFDGFGIEDEMRIVDASGNPVSLTHAVRVYDPTAKRWSISGLDVYRTRFSASTATWTNGEMVATGTGTDPEGKPSMTRTRYFEISPTGFRMEQDRSADNGATWAKATIKITARKVAAAAPR